MTYKEVQDVILKYAPEMAIRFADKLQRFPTGDNAATIVDYLNDKAQFYYDIDESVARLLADAGAEIIVKCG